MHLPHDELMMNYTNSLNGDSFLIIIIRITDHHLPLFKTNPAVRQRKPFNFLMAWPCGSDSLGTRRPDHTHH